MAGASTSVYEFDNVVRGQHVYKSAWTPLTDKTRKCILREDKQNMIKLRCKQLIVSASKKEDAKHQKKDIENKLIFNNVWHYFNVY